MWGLKLCKNVRPSNYVTCAVVLASFRQDEDVALKLPKIIVKKVLDEALLLKR